MTSRDREPFDVGLASDRGDEDEAQHQLDRVRDAVSALADAADLPDGWLHAEQVKGKATDPHEVTETIDYWIDRTEDGLHVTIDLRHIIPQQPRGDADSGQGSAESGHFDRSTSQIEGSSMREGSRWSLGPVRLMAFATIIAGLVTALFSVVLIVATDASVGTLGLIAALGVLGLFVAFSVSVRRVRNESEVLREVARRPVKAQRA